MRIMREIGGKRQENQMRVERIEKGVKEKRDEREKWREDERREERGRGSEGGKVRREEIVKQGEGETGDEKRKRIKKNVLKKMNKNVQCKSKSQKDEIKIKITKITTTKKNE